MCKISSFRFHSTHLQQHEGDKRWHNSHLCMNYSCGHYIHLFSTFLRNTSWFPLSRLFVVLPCLFNHIPREKPGIVIFAVQTLENSCCQTNPHIGSQILFGPSSPLHCPSRPGLQPAGTDRQHVPAKRKRNSGGEKQRELKEQNILKE